MKARLPIWPFGLATLAVACGAGIDIVVKLVGDATGLHTLLAWRFAFGSVIATAVFLAARRPLPDRAAFVFHGSRGLLIVASAWTFFYALLQLGLAETITLGFTAVLMVPFMARVLLGERVRPLVLVTTLIGFVGVVIVLSGEPATPPETRNRVLGVAAVLTSAVLYALSLTLLRVRAQKEDAETIMWLGNGVPALLLMPAWLVFSGPFQVPQEWPWLALIGLLGYVTWYLFTRAYARAPAQLLAPLEYTALIWAALFGWFVFREPVPLTLYAGAAVIIAACLGVVLEGRRKTDVPEA